MKKLAELEAICRKVGCGFTSVAGWNRLEITIAAAQKGPNAITFANCGPNFEKNILKASLTFDIAQLLVALPTFMIDLLMESGNVSATRFRFQINEL